MKTEENMTWHIYTYAEPGRKAYLFGSFVVFSHRSRNSTTFQHSYASRIYPSPNFLYASQAEIMSKAIVWIQMHIDVFPENIRIVLHSEDRSFVAFMAGDDWDTALGERTAYLARRVAALLNARGSTLVFTTISPELNAESRFYAERERELFNWSRSKNLELLISKNRKFTMAVQRDLIHQATDEDIQLLHSKPYLWYFSLEYIRQELPEDAKECITRQEYILEKVLIPQFSERKREVS
jgi:hypothetical protein